MAPELGCGSISTPAFDGQTLFSGAGQSDQSGAPSGAVYAIDPVTQTVVWTSLLTGVVLAPVIVTPGLIFAPTTDGLVILDSSSGAPVWRDPDTTSLYGQAVVANGQNVLVATPTVLTFTHVKGGPAPVAQTIRTYSSGASVKITTLGDQPWLSLGSAGRFDSGVIRVVVNPSSLDPGRYEGGVALTDFRGCGGEAHRTRGAAFVDAGKHREWRKFRGRPPSPG